MTQSMVMKNWVLISIRLVFDWGLDTHAGNVNQSSHSRGSFLIRLPVNRNATAAVVRAIRVVLTPITKGPRSCLIWASW